MRGKETHPASSSGLYPLGAPSQPAYSETMQRAHALSALSTLFLVSVFVACGSDGDEAIDDDAMGGASTGGKGLGGETSTGGDSMGGATGDGGSASGGQDGTGGGGPVLLPQVTVTVFGAGAGRAVELLDGTNRSGVTDAEGKVTFDDVVTPYGVAGVVVAGADAPGVLEVQGLTRDDPTLVMPTGFVNISNMRTSGTATLSVPAGVTVPGGGVLTNIVGTQMNNTVVATDTSGEWTNRGLVWPGPDPQTTRMFGLYLSTGAGRPFYIASGESTEMTFEDGVDVTGITFNVNEAVPALDHQITLDFRDLDEATPATVSLWSANIRGARFPMGSSFGRNTLHTIGGHSGANVVVDSAVPQAGGALEAVFGDDFSALGTGTWVQLAQPIDGVSTTFVVDADKAVDASPASLPDFTSAPILTWSEIDGASAIEITVTQDSVAGYPIYRGVLPGDATSLDLSALYSLTAALDPDEDYTVSIQSVFLEGFSPDVDADGFGRLLQAGSGRLGDADEFEIHRSNLRWE